MQRVEAKCKAASSAVVVRTREARSQQHRKTGSGKVQKSKSIEDEAEQSRSTSVGWLVEKKGDKWGGGRSGIGLCLHLVRLFFCLQLLFTCCIQPYNSL